MGQYYNIAKTFEKDGVTPIKESSKAYFYIVDSSTLTVTKRADKEDPVTGEYEYYVKGDTIIFYITITNSDEAKLKDFIFEDQIDSVVELSTTGPDYGITESTGTGTIVAPSGNLVKITGIDLDKGATCDITITGTIK